MSRRIALLIFLAATAVGLFFAIQAYYNPAIQPPLRWGQALAVNLIFYYLWALTTPIVIAMARRFRFDNAQWWLAIVAHLVVSSIVTAGEIVIGETLLTLLGMRGGVPIWENVRFSFIVNFQSSLPTYWLMLFVFLAFDYYVKYRDREVRAAQLAAQLSRAQLQALKMQLKPHFLFNTLNSISSLMYSDVEAADAMLARLSEFLRLTLDRELEQEVTLEEELEFVRRYLEIEKIRFDERLHVDVDVESGIESARVPSLALQPLIENAIHHGIASRPEGGSIAIRARRDDAMLHISVADDGVGAPSSGGVHERVGLANTRARLDHLYGGDHRFSFGPSASGGFVVDIVIPYRAA